ncbi:MAG: PEP-CTERM sorting domain-containing protein [Chromatiales bacterium]|nr:PEP-CTERM sorting domain-containing protein [Chromatiales bacterium]
MAHATSAAVPEPNILALGGIGAVAAVLIWRISRRR